MWHRFRGFHADKNCIFAVFSPQLGSTIFITLPVPHKYDLIKMDFVAYKEIYNFLTQKLHNQMEDNNYDDPLSPALLIHIFHSFV